MAQWTKIGLALVCGVMEFVSNMKKSVTMDQVADKAINYVREARDERAEAEKAEDGVFDGNLQG